MSTQPSLFISHGVPTFAIDPSAWTPLMIFVGFLFLALVP